MKAKEKPESPPNTPKVYSYARLSNQEQDMGDSERRQLEMTKAFAEKKGLPFDETLRMTDKGFSGYHGDHRKKGVLGQFLHKVESGAVPRGSILVVENIDRLSREGVVTTLREIIFKLWDYGITLQTLSPEECYEPGCDNEPKFLALWMYMNRAHDESLQKSIRIKSARKNARKLARETGKILTARCPAWLKVKENEFEVIPEAGETIKMIFDLKLKGVGKVAIAKTLNSNGVWKPPPNKRKLIKGNGWRESYIQKILQNRAVVGEYQPHEIDSKGKREPIGEPIPNYYPRVIEDDAFLTVQEKFKENKGKGGRRGKARNLLRHLVKCAYCGGSMAFVDKGKPPKGASYLVCDNARLGIKCTRHSIRYDECERIVLENCRGLRVDEVLPNPNEQSRRCLSLRKRVQGHITKLRDIKKRIGNLINQISEESDTEVGKLLKNKIEELQEQTKEIKVQQETDERELRKAESSLQSFTKWQKDLASLQKAIKKDNNVELRMHLQTHLRELIEKIEVFPIGFKELYDIYKDDGYRAGRIVHKDGKKKVLKSPGYFDRTETIENELYDVVGEADPEFVRSKLFRDFAKDLIKRRMSKEGRFLRIYFKTGVWIDIVPEGKRLGLNLIYGDNIVATGSYNCQRSLDGLLAFNICKVNLIARGYSEKLLDINCRCL